MVLNSLAHILVLLVAAPCVSSETYSLSSHLTGQKFVNAFKWVANPDPNGGRVNYVNLATARAKGLVSVSGNQVTLSADSTTALNSTGPGRNSFDLVSFNTYTTHVAIFDIAHMPVGCGTWPAVCTSRGQSISVFHCLVAPLTQSDERTFRELGEDWPNGGELDILEGVNDQSPDLITLHTGPGCMMPADRKMAGTSKGTNCNVWETDNASCGVSINATNSYGPSFNAAGGGWYAIERTPSFIKVFFWSRKNPSVPKQVSHPGSGIDTDTWGTPTAYFPSSTNCNFERRLSAFQIVINLDFCGAWAGNAQVYKKSGCPSTCYEYVSANPSAFRNAHFTFNALTIYE